MNALRQCVRPAVCRRTYATMYVPPASLEKISHRQRFQKPIPESPNFYTGRAVFYDQVNALEYAIQSTRHALQKLELLPLPKFALASLPPLQHVWMSKDTMSERLNTRLSTTRYRRLTTLLIQLANYRRIAAVAGCEPLAEQVQDVLDLFERENKEAFLARGKRKPVKFDQYGRSYTVGRRKESTARAWVIPVQAASSSSTAAAASSSLQIQDASEPVPVPTTNILINNTPLSRYFVTTADRERIVRPFKIAGLVGAFNVFALVRGGGTTGQSGAVSLAIAKALAAHVPDVEPLLRKAKLMRRDPRMVERKKTGRAKARKAYTWVKR